MKVGDYIALPESLPDFRRKHVINVQTEKNCLKKSILAAVFGNNSAEVAKRERTNPNAYNHLERHFNFNRISNLSTFLDLEKFEDDNIGFALNVYSLHVGSDVCEDKDFFDTIECVRISKQIDDLSSGVQIINLLLLYDEKTWHFTAITDSNKFFRY